MNTFTRLLALAGLLLFYAACGSEKAYQDCEAECRLPRQCLFNECRCQDGTVFSNGFCVPPDNNNFIARLPETDGLDTFIFAFAPSILTDDSGAAIGRIRRQSQPMSSSGIQMEFYRSDANQVTILAPGFQSPATGSFLNRLDGQQFVFEFTAEYEGTAPDSLRARLRWVGSATGQDLRPPLEFVMYEVK